ncbi:MAG: hypothetical protein LBH43_08690, partial [Treponema sp.]|nr:hypothetical protein [Treponema sp.]
MLKNILKRTFIKYLLSYILCLILPVSIFSFLYKTIYLSAFTDQLIGRTSQSLDDAFGIIDIRMSNLRDISSQVFLSREFSDSYLNETPGILAYYTIKDTLKVFSVPNEFIFDIWVFDRNNNSFYSSRHMLSLDSFIRYGSGYFGVNDKTFDQII